MARKKWQTCSPEHKSKSCFVTIKRRANSKRVGNTEQYCLVGSVIDFVQIFYLCKD